MVICLAGHALVLVLDLLHSYVIVDRQSPPKSQAQRQELQAVNVIVSQAQRRELQAVNVIVNVNVMQHYAVSVTYYSELDHLSSEFYFDFLHFSLSLASSFSFSC